MCGERRGALVPSLSLHYHQNNMGHPHDSGFARHPMSSAASPLAESNALSAVHLRDGQARQPLRAITYIRLEVAGLGRRLRAFMVAQTEPDRRKTSPQAHDQDSPAAQRVRVRSTSLLITVTTGQLVTEMAVSSP